MVEDEPEDDEEDLAGPEMLPDLIDDESDDEEDDAEGRFFGGGVGRDTAAAMNFLDQHDQDNAIVSVHDSYYWI